MANKNNDLCGSGATPRRRNRGSAYHLLIRIDRNLSRLLRRLEEPADHRFTVRKAAATAGVSITTIYRAIHASKAPHRLRAFNVGTGKKATWRIDPTDLDAWVKRKERKDTLPSPQTYQSRPGQSRHFRF